MQWDFPSKHITKPIHLALAANEDVENAHATEIIPAIPLHPPETIKILQIVMQSIID